MPDPDFKDVKINGYVDEASGLLTFKADLGGPEILLTAVKLGRLTKAQRLYEEAQAEKKTAAKK